MPDKMNLEREKRVERVCRRERLVPGLPPSSMHFHLGNLVFLYLKRDILAMIKFGKCFLPVMITNLFSVNNYWNLEVMYAIYHQQLYFHLFYVTSLFWIMGTLYFEPLHLNVIFHVFVECLFHYVDCKSRLCQV